jgi:uncharacterized protein (TIRG00374 family)
VKVAACIGRDAHPGKSNPQTEEVSMRQRVTTASMDFPNCQDACGTTERRQWMRPLVVTLSKYAISIAVLAFLFQRAAKDESFAILSQQQVNWFYLTMALVIAIVASMISFLRLYLLVRAIDLRITLLEAARLGFLGILFSFLSLGVLGGDLIKALLLARRDPGRRTEALTAIFVDRMLGVYALFVIATVAILATDLNQLQVRDPGELAMVRSLCWMTVGATPAGLIGIFMIGLSHRVRIPFAESLHRAPRIGPIVQRVTTAIRTYRDKPLLMVGAALMTIGCHISTIVAIYVMAIGLPGVVPSFGTHLIVVPISLVAGSLPLPGGMGAFEFMLDFLYHAISPLAVPARQGFLVAVAYRGITIIIALIGAACCLFGRKELSQVFSEAEQEQLENKNSDGTPQATAPSGQADEPSLHIARPQKKAA